MSITTSVTKPLGQEYMQVDAKQKNGYTRYYKVPKRDAKNFAIKLREQDKNLNMYSNVIFFTSIFAGVLGAAYFTKNFESKMKQFITQTASAIGLAMASSLGFNIYAKNEEEMLIKQHNAREIFYRT